METQDWSTWNPIKPEFGRIANKDTMIRRRIDRCQIRGNTDLGDFDVQQKLPKGKRDL